MKKSLKISLMIVVVLLTALVSSTAFAGTAYDASFTTAITYQNVSDTATTSLVVSFQAESSATATPKTLANLAGGASSSVFLGSVDEVTAGFVGAAVMSADQPIVATLVQISSDSDVVNRPLSNGFSSGSSTVLLASLLKNTFNQSSKFSVQNVDSTPADITISIYNASAPTAAPTQITIDSLPAGAAKHYDMGTISAITSNSFNGSAVITAVQEDTATAGSIVATVMELSTNGSGASAFEGIASGGTTLYMPSALCDAFGGQQTFYALQNTSTTEIADVTVTYSTGATEDTTIDPGAKKSILGCTTLSSNTSGSATITSDEPIIGLQKVSGAGLSAATPGATSGDDKLALPYVRWTESQWSANGRQRTYMAIQNVGADLASGTVTISYINKDGDVVGIHTLGAMTTGAKLNSRADLATVQSGFSQSDLDEFGYIDGFGGGALIEGPSGSQLVAVARIISQTDSGSVGEDYNGTPVD